MKINRSESGQGTIAAALALWVFICVIGCIASVVQGAIQDAREQARVEAVQAAAGNITLSDIRYDYSFDYDAEKSASTVTFVVNNGDSKPRQICVRAAISARFHDLRPNPRRDSTMWWWSDTWNGPICPTYAAGSSTQVMIRFDNEQNVKNMYTGEIWSRLSDQPDQVCVLLAEIDSVMVARLGPDDGWKLNPSVDCDWY